MVWSELNNTNEIDGLNTQYSAFRKPKLIRASARKRGLKRSTLSQNVFNQSLQKVLNDWDSSSSIPKIISNLNSTMELNCLSLNHLKQISAQILSNANLLDWQDVVYNLLLKITRNVNPDIRMGDDKDIRHYIKIKRIPGGAPAHSHYVSGVVCTKNVCHKKMCVPKDNPRILLLTFALEYQRVENEFISLAVLLAQEREHLKNLVNRVVALKPDIVLVQKTVSRLALEFLLQAGVTVAYGVKPSVMEAIARCTLSDIISGIDQLTLDPKLGKSAVLAELRYMYQI